MWHGCVDHTGCILNSGRATRHTLADHTCVSCNNHHTNRHNTACEAKQAAQVAALQTS